MFSAAIQVPNIMPSTPSAVASKRVHIVAVSAELRRAIRHAFIAHRLVLGGIGLDLIQIHEI
jgi:hypothetical protein